MKYNVLFALVVVGILFVGCAEQEAMQDTPVAETQEVPPAEETIEETIIAEEATGIETQPVEEETIIVAEEENNGISREELAIHNTANSCWVAYQGRVYDLTQWLRQHPGGAQAILPNCGTAEQFEEAFTARHGTRDDGLLRNAPIGTFAG